MLNPVEIATTIRNQIGSNTLMCIGAHNMAAMPANSESMGGLRMKCLPCPKIRGGSTVTIELNPSDTYTLKVYNNRMRLIHEREMVYCDKLSGPTGAIEQVLG
jgi:hypothetical protein